MRTPIALFISIFILTACSGGKADYGKTITEHLLSKVPAGKKIGLISLLYAFDTMGVIDNGNISLRKIQEFAEVHFDVKLGNIARAFNELRMRQNPTQFIDELKAALEKRIREADDRNTLGHYVGQSTFSKK